MDYMVKVARLYYEQNMTQQEIAKHLNISRIKVYRMLIKAREEGLVKIEVCAPPQDFSELEIRVERSFGIKQCIIIPTSDSTDSIYNGFAKALSSIIDSYFEKGMSIGIGWGQTIKSTVERIKFSKKYDMKIFPAVGGTSMICADDIHANSIVSVFASKSGSTGYLLNCPAIIDSQASKDIFLKERAIKKIVDEFENLDLAIVPIGYIDSDITIFRTGDIDKEELEYLRSLNIVGDINSNFIDENGMPVENKLRERIINVSLETLKNIKNTVAICYGEKKIVATRAALNSGAIDILITDSSTAEKL